MRGGEAGEGMRMCGAAYYARKAFGPGFCYPKLVCWKKKEGECKKRRIHGLMAPHIA